MYLESSCLSCSDQIRIIDGTLVGEIVACTSCGQEHEVVAIQSKKVELSFAPEVEEDWGE